VFNPQAWKVREPVEVEVERLGSRPPRLLRDDGKELIYQEIRTAGVKVSSRIRLAFMDEFPSFGYALYYLDFSGKEDPPQTRAAETAVGRVMAGPDVLENDLVRVSFDGKSGAIRSYFDKTSNRELLRAPAEAIVLEDPDDTWGHRIKAYDKEVGRFGAADFKVIESGPERGWIQIVTHFGESSLLQDYILYASINELHCRLTVNWNEYYNVLKIAIPTVLNMGTMTYSIPYGFIERPMNGEEEPGQTWVDISGRETEGKVVTVLADKPIPYRLRPCEIKTILLPLDRKKPPREVNFLEGIQFYH